MQISYILLAVTVSRSALTDNGLLQPKTFSSVLLYEGCFVDNSARILTTMLADSKSNTPQECAKRCGNAGYVYAGVEVSWLISSDMFFSGIQLLNYLSQSRFKSYLMRVPYNIFKKIAGAFL